MTEARPNLYYDHEDVDRVRPRAGSQRDHGEAHSAILANEGKAGGPAAKLPKGRVGRFGRKATDHDLVTFVNGAFPTEQSMTIPNELSPDDRDATVDFFRFLARRAADGLRARARPPDPFAAVDRSTSTPGPSHW